MESLREVQVASNLVIDIDEMTAFIKEGKQAGYASGIKPTYDPVLKIKRLVYRHGPWLYIDEYYGSFMAPGTEKVYYAISQGFWDDKRPLEENLRYFMPVWQMSYAGGIKPQYWQNEVINKPTYRILKTALSDPMERLPVRGPETLETDDGNYLCELQGDITCFGGYEGITLRHQKLAELLQNDGLDIDSSITFFQYISGSIIVYNHQKV